MIKQQAMYRLLAITLGLVGALLADSTARGEEPSARDRSLVLQIQLEDEAISPIMARFIERAIEQAEREGAECLVIILDTPGGLLDSTRKVVKEMLRSRVPVVVYVAPSGARAMSAGVFITLASHVAAMAPGTNIGGAHPVQPGGLPISPAPTDDKDKDDDDDSRRPSPIETKVVNDTVAWARSLAELRERNADWAAGAVRKSLSVTSSEALREGVIELIANNVDDLLEQIDGRSVTLPHDTVRLRTAGAEVRTLEMWWGERFLAILSSPNVAFLLMVFGFYGILFELYSPGWGVAGTLGVICLVLAFFALAVLPINYVGLALIALALAMFLAEAFVTSFGFLTLGGIICLVLGGLMLVDSPVGFQRVSLTLLIPIAMATAGVTFFLFGSIVKAHRGRVQTGSEGLGSETARAAEDFTPDGDEYKGTVRMHGEWWRAVSSVPVSASQTLTVRERRGLTLLVHPNDAEPAKPPENP